MYRPYYVTLESIDCTATWTWRWRQCPLLAPSVRSPQIVWGCVCLCVCSGIVQNEICGYANVGHTLSSFCTHAHILKPFEDGELSGLKVDIAPLQMCPCCTKCCRSQLSGCLYLASSSSGPSMKISIFQWYLVRSWPFIGINRFLAIFMYLLEKVAYCQRSGRNLFRPIAMTTKTGSWFSVLPFAILICCWGILSVLHASE